MVDRTGDWLRRVGLGEHVSLFAEQRIDWEILPDLSAADLETLGLPLGHRKRFLKAVAETDWNGEAPPPAADAAHAERRQLTVMFCDLVGSTALSARLDPEDLSDVNRAYQDLCKETLESFGGYIARYMGDGVLAYFGYPRANEDDAERAVLAGLALVDAVGRLDPPPLRNADVDLAVRVGIATGPVVVGDLIGEGASQESAVVGETPNVAARLQSLTGPGTVAVAPGTHAVVGERFEYADGGTHAIKGIDEPVQVRRVIGRGSAESRFEALHRTALTPLVGRETEVALLLDRWRQAREGDGQVVVLTGEAGIGKSRIAETLRERTAGEQSTRLRYQCSPHHAGSELFPFVEAMQRAAGFENADPAAIRLDKIESLLARGTDDVAAVAPLVAALLSVSTGDRYPFSELSADVLKARTLDALTEQLDGLSRELPVLMVFEDAHWADPTSLELLAMQIEQSRQKRVLMLITARPEFSPPWSEFPHITTFNLNRFSRNLATAMIDRVARGKALPDEVRKQIIEKTDGVPLFVEELTKTVLESDWLTETRDAYELSGPSPSLVIPSTLNDSLMARLDRLGPIKEVAQTAAAIGREFTCELLAAVSPLGREEIGEALDTLVRSELIFPVGRSGGSYIFKHALVLDAAYDSMLRKRRRELHGQIAEAIEEGFPEIVSGQPEVLARHFAAAGELESAIRYWLRAGRRAAERSANKEAVLHFRAGLDALENLPPSTDRDRLELALQIGMTTPITAISGFASVESEESYGRARELCELLGETDQLVTVLHGHWVKLTVALGHREAAKIASQLLRMGEEKQNDHARIIGHRITGWNRLFRGDLDTADSQLRIALSIYESDPEKYKELRLRTHHDARVATLSAMTIQQLLRGYPEQSRITGEACIARARELGHATSLAYALFHGGCSPAAMRHDPEAAERYATELVTLAKEQSLPAYLTNGSIINGWIMGTTGDTASGISRMTESISIIGKGRFKYFLTCFLEMLARLHLRAGDVDEALRVLEEARELAERTDEVLWLAEIVRMLGDAKLAADGAEEAAVAHYERAIEIARAAGAKALELRAATSLARLRARAGRAADARAVLAPVYEWFTEGLDSPDLQAARSVLDGIG